ncbi:trypsin-1-like [Leptopilina heterotoma]|uniref:trypsin-1-like n=1 Tax=Leptopilina heterotoma TaxID=63436 RepID=UPI001CA7C292|nr:trypsin-1-like [Leptopilina heterotoma]
MLGYFVLSVLLATVNADPIREFVGINPFTPNGRIVGGNPTTIEEVPYQVSLQAYGFSFCGGSIISENWILTAGHCTKYPSQWINVRTGSTNFNSGGTLHPVEKIIQHEKFKTNKYGIPENDVALIQLKTPLELGTTRKPIPLFDQGEEAVEGSLATITGWGTVKQGGKVSEILRTVDIPVVSKGVCSESYKRFGGIPEGQICAAYPQGGKDACQGDSGGPMIIGGKLAGIVSWGNGCALKGYPGVYTEIASYKDWIVKNAGL